ncbi:major facilitator superfamily domain-containing protein [Apodospora peruviana]|uniref:Major facilitator superfamily domain-containing protein n=1 Tax=Apodospora peruviana TaxID=516989 RepID=A0AAE0HTY3_9PEZI|nr:major facilitator superfamily domain-containing protein [Apodospora peruviana]
MSNPSATATSIPSPETGDELLPEKNAHQYRSPPNNDVDTEKEQQQTDDSLNNQDDADCDKPPDGGLQAWLVTIGTAMIFFCGIGYSNSFGIFQEYYMVHQLPDKSADDIAWIGSLSAFLQFATGAVGGPLFDRYGAWIIRPAAILFVFAMMMTSLCSQYWHFMLAQGTLMGISLGLLTVPSMAAVSQHFDRNRSAALGLAIAGSSIGGVLFPIVFAKLLNESSLGFGWTVRIIGFVTIPLFGFACLAVRSRLPPRRTQFFIWHAFKEPRLMILVVAFFLMLMGLFTPLFFIPAYAVTRGMKTTLASYLLAIINAASLFGRVIPGVLADRFGPINVFGLAGIVTGVVLLCLNTADSTAGLVVYSVVFGFTSGTIISGGSAAFTRCPRDPKDIGTYIGMGMGVGSIAILIGPPINGVLIDRYGGFLQVSVFSGVMCLVGGFVAFGAKAVTPQGILGRV